MISFDALDDLSSPLIDLYSEFELSVIRDIARRISKMVIPSAAFQVQRLQESGSVYRNVISELSKLTGKSEAELKAIFQEAGVKTIDLDDEIYKANGLKALPFSDAMKDTLLAGIRKTNGLISNLTMTTAIDASQKIVRALDIANLQVTSGVMSYDKAIKEAIKSVGNSGLEVTYPSGHKDKLDVMVRRATLTGVAQTAGTLQLQRAEQYGADLVSVSSHVGARNKGAGPMNHESWQGKIYSRNSNNDKYEDFVTTTGFGTGEGLMGWNCRHSWHPWFEGMSIPEPIKDDLVTYNGKQMSSYEASQIQRMMERKVRSWKRQAEALGAAGIDNTKELAKIKEWQTNLRDFTKQTGLQRQYIREQVVGAGPIKRVEIQPIIPIEPVAPKAPKNIETVVESIPVREALDTSGLKNRNIKNQVSTALDAIDKVHKDGNLPKIPITQDAGRGNFGAYKYHLDGRSLEIGLATKGNHQALTMVHEAGHFIDHKGIDNRWSLSKNENILGAMKKSKWWTEFNENIKQAHIKAAARNMMITFDERWLAYLRSDKELIARAYAQFIANESKNELLLAQLKALQEKSFPTQWQDHDFEEIAKEFRKVFRERGWM